jgi:hypothetical protein
MDEAPKVSTAEYRLTIEPGKLIVGLSLVACMLLLVHGVLTVYHYQVAEIEWIPWRQLFDVDEENNLPTWFSGGLAGITALWLWVQAESSRANADRWALHWRVLCVGFLLISLDEIAGIHETINTVISITWAIPFGILALVIGLSFFPFLWALPKHTRNTFVLGGILFVGGAIGIEMIGAPMVEDAMPYNLLTIVEEGMEMFGVIVFLAGLLRFMRRQTSAAAPVSVAVSLGE